MLICSAIKRSLSRGVPGGIGTGVRRASRKRVRVGLYAGLRDENDLERSVLFEASTGGGVFAFGKKTLKDQNRGYLIDDCAVLLASVAHGVKMAVGLAGGEPLVRKMDRQAERDAQILGEGLGLERLRTDLARHVQGVADDELNNCMFADHPADRLHIGVRRAAMKREERLHGDAERIRDRESDTLAADVQAEDAWRQQGSGSTRFAQIIHSRSVAGGQGQRQSGEDDEAAARTLE